MNLNFSDATLEITAGFPEQFPVNDLGQIVLTGRSNVGKSSLINLILGRKSLARVSSSPGKTVTINFYNVNKQLYLVDLPGYGFAKRSFESKSRWSNLTDCYLKKCDRIIYSFCLVDIKVGPTPDDIMMFDYFNSNGIPFSIIGTKSDKLSSSELDNSYKRLLSQYLYDPEYVLLTSFKSGKGKEELRSLISAIISK